MPPQLWIAEIKKERNNEMSYRDIESIDDAKKKLLKLNKQEYQINDIEFVLSQLNNNLSHKEISKLTDCFSTRQIKLIRVIYRKGTEQDMHLLKTCRYKISSIKRYVQAKPLASRHRDPKFKLASIMERGKIKGSLTGNI